MSAPTFRTKRGGGGRFQHASFEEGGGDKFAVLELREGGGQNFSAWKSEHSSAPGRTLIMTAPLPIPERNWQKWTKQSMASYFRHGD